MLCACVFKLSWRAYSLLGVKISRPLSLRYIINPCSHGQKMFDAIATTTQMSSTKPRKNSLLACVFLTGRSVLSAGQHLLPGSRTARRVFGRLIWKRAPMHCTAKGGISEQTAVKKRQQPRNLLKLFFEFSLQSLTSSLRSNRSPLKLKWLQFSEQKKKLMWLVALSLCQRPTSTGSS